MSALALGNNAKAYGRSSVAIGNGANTTAGAVGSIALGDAARANERDTMFVGLPIRIERRDGRSQLRVTEKNSGTNVRTLINLICERCTPGFRFNRIFPSNDAWFFRMLQNGDFSIDDPATIIKEVEFRSGGDLKIGGTLIQASSRELKKDFVEINNQDVLKKIDQLPITQWSYKKDQGKVKQFGPVAEDFYQVFGLGDTNKGIASVDTAGVTLAAIKALKSENDELKDMLENQSKEIEKLKLAVARLIQG